MTTQLHLQFEACRACGHRARLYWCQGKQICTRCLRAVEAAIATAMSAPGYVERYGHHDTGGKLMRGRKR